MPPEMITIVAPIAMIAKKLASVAVWISVYEFQKLLTVAPVTRSGCDPASSVSAMRDERQHDDESGFLRTDELSSECAHASETDGERVSPIDIRAATWAGAAR